MADNNEVATIMGEEIKKYGDPGMAIYSLRKQLDAFNQYKLDCRLCRHYEWNRRRCLNVAKCEDGELFTPTDTVMLYGYNAQST